MNNDPCPPPTQFVKLLKSITEKKQLNENYVEYYFSMGIVLVNFKYRRAQEAGKGRAEGIIL